MSEKTDAVVLFRTFLEKNKLSASEAARALGVSHVAVSAWMRLISRPDAHMREKIAVWTDGWVPAEKWLRPGEAARIGDMKPFEPKQAG